MTGEAFGSRYRLGDLVGRGAMGRVHIASSAESDGPIAIKLLRDDLASEPEVVGRFLQESYLLRSIDDQNVVTIRDLVAESGRLGIVMDYVGGGDLRSAVAFPTYANDALFIIAQISSGLAAVHAAGIIHRDLKPENVLVDPSNDHLRLKITDFGISRLMSKATRTTSIVGTPVYMAPEVAEGSQPTPAVDIYALGVIFYELLTGRPPFAADSHYALLRAHMEDPVARPSGLPDDVWQLLVSMLAKDPRKRPSALEVTQIALPLARSVGDIGPFDVPERQSTEFRARPEHQRPSEVLAPELSGSHGRLRTTEGVFQRRRRMMALGFVALALTVMATVLLWPRENPGGTVVSAAAATTYAFQPLIIKDNIVTRQWELQGTVLRAQITVKNNGSKTSTGDHYEVIPKSVANDVGLVSFEPEDPEIIERDPVVRYSLQGLVPGGQRIFSWSVDLGDMASEEGILQILAKDQRKAEAQFFERNPSLGVDATLESLDLQPGDMTLSASESIVLTLSGRMSDDSIASADLLVGVLWTSSDPSVVAVDSRGRITALSPGSAVISVSAGDVSVSSAVIVNLPETTPPPTTKQAAPTPAPTTQPATTTATQPVTTTARPPAPTTTIRPVTTTTIRPVTTTTTQPVTTTTRPPAPTTTQPPPPPPPVVTISKGAPKSVPGVCTSSACAYVRVSISNLSGPYTVTMYDNWGVGWGPSGCTYSPSATTSEYCVFGFPGYQVYVIVNGVWSNTISW